MRVSRLLPFRQRGDRRLGERLSAARRASSRRSSADASAGVGYITPEAARGARESASTSFVRPAEDPDTAELRPGVPPRTTAVGETDFSSGSGAVVAESATSSLECTDANHERSARSSMTASSEGDDWVFTFFDPLDVRLEILLGEFVSMPSSRRTASAGGNAADAAGVLAGVGCVALFPGVVAAAASTMVAAFTAFRTVGENAPPRALHLIEVVAAAHRAWKAVGDDSRTGEGRRRFKKSRPRRDGDGSAESSAALFLFCDSAVPGVDPAPVELKLRSKSSVVREKPAAGVTGVRAAGFGDLGVSGALRAGSVGVAAKRFATAASCACSVLGESGWPLGREGRAQERQRVLGAHRGVLLVKHARVLRVGAHSRWGVAGQEGRARSATGSKDAKTRCFATFRAAAKRVTR